MKQQNLKCLIFTLLIAFSFITCKKTDEDVLANISTTSAPDQTAKFFTIPPSTSPAVQLVVREIEKRNKSTEFVNEFVQNCGFPVWDKVMLLSVSGANNILGNVSQDTVIYIPLVLPNGSSVNGYIRAVINDSISISHALASDYAQHPFTPAPGTTADMFAAKIMYLNGLVFNKQHFRILDKRLFHGNTNYADSANISRMVKIEPVDANSLLALICYNQSVWTIGANWHCTHTGPCEAGPCDGCNLCVDYSVSHNTTQNCVYEEMGGGTGNGVPWNPGPIGSGGINSSPIGYLPIGEIYSDFDPFITNTDPDIAWWTDEITTYPSQPKPSWAQIYANFPKKSDGSEMCGEDVYNLIGGNVRLMMPNPPNACALRVSRALNYSGVNIPNIPNHTFLGGDGKYYFLSSAKLYNFLRKTFGTPTTTLSQTQGGPGGVNFPSLLSGKKGIYLMQVNTPKLFGALGHASLYTGNSCVPHNCDQSSNNGCYFDAEGGVYKIYLWELN